MIRLVSYNILFSWNDHLFEKEYHWKVRCPRLIELIKEMNPDILGVQELFPPENGDFFPYLQEEYDFVVTPCSDGEMTGVIFRKSRFVCLDHQVWFFQDSRALNMVQLRDKKTGALFAVFNIHFSFANIEKREFQARGTQEIIESFSKEMPVILMGDLNTFPNRLDLMKLPYYDGDYIHRILTKGCLRDAIEVSLLGHLGPIATFTNEGDDPKPFRGLGHSGRFS